MDESKNHSTGLTGLPTPPPGSAGDLELRVQRINDKLQLLLRQREALLKENEKLKTELREWKAVHKSHAARLEQLQQQVEILKASKGEMNEGEKKGFEKRLNQYIREIDRCIALLAE
jgi:predicted nuclease with TOPRIM domain